MKAIGYTRCSTNEQADSGSGLDAQAERIKAYCTLKGLELAEVLDIFEVGDLVVVHPQLVKALELALQAFDLLDLVHCQVQDLQLRQLLEA